MITPARLGFLLGGMLVWAATASAMAPGERNYRLHCMGCHQADGSGSPDKGVPSMKGEVGRFLQVPGGRAYLSQVPGTLNTPLGNRETAEMLTWVVRVIGGSSVPADFVPYTGEEVARFRSDIPADIPALRARLISQMPSASATSMSSK